MTEENSNNPNEAELLAAMTLSPEEKKDYIATAGSPLPQGEKKATKEDIIEALKTVCDPEIMINIWDMGLVYDIRIDDEANVEIDMTLTAPGCPVAGVLPQQAADAVSLVEGTGVVTVKIVWEPAWSMERLSEDARAMMELF